MPVPEVPASGSAGDVPDTGSNTEEPLAEAAGDVDLTIG